MSWSFSVFLKFHYPGKNVSTLCWVPLVTKECLTSVKFQYCQRYCSSFNKQIVVYYRTNRYLLQFFCCYLVRQNLRSNLVIILAVYISNSKIAFNIPTYMKLHRNLWSYEKSVISFSFWDYIYKFSNFNGSHAWPPCNNIYSIWVGHN